MPNLDNVRETNDNVDILEAFKVAWRGKIIILILTLSAAIYGVTYSSKIQPMYRSTSMFGFQNSQKPNIDLAGIMAMSGFSQNSTMDKSDTLTQINGRDFLKKVTVKLDLVSDPEFFVKPSQNVQWSLSLNSFKRVIKLISGANTKVKPFTKEEEIESTILALKEFVLINKIRTGGIEVVVSTSDPKKSALIANTITKTFLDTRLESKTKKSDKTLNYLAQKLGEAQIDMSEAEKNIEKYILEENVLSRPEFELQTRKLREFRSSIEDLELLLEQIAELKDFFISAIQTDPLLETNLDLFYVLSPRMRPRSNVTTTSQSRNFLAELASARGNIDPEIKRIQNSLKVTVAGLKKLELEARRNAKDARNLIGLERAALIKSAAYDMLMKQFESHSITEGYQEVIGEIYQTATPPRYPYEPNKPLITLYITLIGLFASVALVFVSSVVSGQIWSATQTKNIFPAIPIITLSKRSETLFSSFIWPWKFLRPYLRPYQVQSDLIDLQNLASQIQVASSSQKDQICIFTIASFKKSRGLGSLAYSIANLVSRNGQKVFILDFSCDFHKTQHTLNTYIMSKGYEKNPLLAQNVSYEGIQKNVSAGYVADILDKIEMIDLSSKSEKLRPVIMIAVDCVEKDLSGVQAILASNCFSLVLNAGQITSSQINRVKSSLGLNFNKCLSCIFVKK